MKLLRVERRCLEAVFATMLPSNADPRLAFGAAEAGMDRFLDDLLRVAPLPFRLALRGCTWLVWLAPPFVLGRWSTFPAMTEADRTAFFEAMAASRVYLVREIPVLFKTVACLGFCGLPDVQRAAGIAPLDAQPPRWARSA